MSIIDKIREAVAGALRKREPTDDELAAEARGETYDARAHKRDVRERSLEEGNPSAGAGFIPPP